MKTAIVNSIFLTGWALLTLAGCTRIEDDLQGGNDVILFGASTSLQNEEETRTEYSNNFTTTDDGRYERIDWVANTDRIRIFCNNAYGGTEASGKASDYTITETVSASNQKSIAYLTPIGENSLRWGSGTHYFYALYPAPGTKCKYGNMEVGQNDATIANASNNRAVINGTVPASQEVFWNATAKEYKPNMNYAYMYAATQVSARSSVTLSFKPLVTTLRFTISTSDTNVGNLTLTGFKLKSSSTNLSGPFKATVKTDATCAIEAGSGTFGQEVSISMNQQKKLNEGPITVTLFTLATATLNNLTIELTLKNSSNQTMTRELDLKKSGSENITVASCCKAYFTNLSIPGGHNTMTVTYPKWTLSGSSSTISGPVTDYTTSDSFGIYAFNSSGTCVLENYALSPTSVNTSAHTATLTVPSGQFWSKNWTYYIYYPRQTNPGTVPSTLTNSSTTADTFFTNVISGWTVETTQNQTTLANYKKSDLQVGKLSGTAFSMTHAMGLAKMNIVNKTAPETITKTFNSTGANPSSTTNSSTNVTLTTSTSLTTATANRMYKDGSNNYWTIVRPSTSTNVTLSSNSGNDAWTLTFSGITSGKYKAANAITARECKNYVLNYNYTGDVKALTIPLTGTYEFFVWGAQGQSTTALTGTNNNGTYRGGYGGYSHGKMSLTKGNIIYIIVGQTGGSGSNNYAWPNGGGSGSSGASSVGTGGGASLITDKSGGVTISGKTSLQSLANSDILIMAGGGGAACWGQQSGSNYWTGHGGAGGGYLGYAGTTNTYYSTAGQGGTQSAGGAAGGVSGKPAGERLAGGGDKSTTCTGGGGGFYGGGSSWGSAGGGGSGYIGNSKLTTDKYMYSYYNSAYTSDSEHTSSATDTKTYSTTTVSSASPPAQSASARQGNGYIIIKSGL